MERPNNIFLSWSDNQSNAIAYHFNEYLPVIVQMAQPFFSSDSIHKDTDWFSSIKNELINAQTGIVFLTKKNREEQWILFEAGGLMSKDSVCIVLCDFDKKELNESSSIFKSLNVTSLKDKTELLKLFKTISYKVSPWVTEKTIEKTLDAFYAEFEGKLNEALKTFESAKNIKNNFSRFHGAWSLQFKKHGGHNGNELFEITENGEYIFKDTIRRGHDFRLNILEINQENVVWQKIKVPKDSQKEEVFGVENLKIMKGDNELVGSDTTGYILDYKRNS